MTWKIELCVSPEVRHDNCWTTKFSRQNHIYERRLSARFTKDFPYGIDCKKEANIVFQINNLVCLNFEKDQNEIAIYKLLNQSKLPREMVISSVNHFLNKFGLKIAKEVNWYSQEDFSWNTEYIDKFA